MIDPNALRQPNRMNFGKMLNYVRQNPMALMDGSMKRPMPGMPPLNPMMMARSGGAPEPMGAVGPTHGGTTFGGLSAPAPDRPEAPDVAPVGPGAFDQAFGQFGRGAIDDAFGQFGAPNQSGLTPGAIQAYAASRNAMAAQPAQAAITRAMARGMPPGMGAVNAAGQPMGGGPAMGSDPFGYGGFANEGYGTNSYGVNPQTAAHEAAAAARGEYGAGMSSGGASGGGGKIVCTAMNEDYGFGSFRQAIWLRQSAGLHPAYQRGYHAMFRPLLAYGRKRSTLAQQAVMAALEDIARMRTFDIRREARAGFWRGLNRGRLYRAVLEPLCFVVGLFNAGR